MPMISPNPMFQSTGGQLGKALQPGRKPISPELQRQHHLKQMEQRDADGENEYLQHPSASCTKTTVSSTVSKTAKPPDPCQYRCMDKAVAMVPLSHLQPSRAEEIDAWPYLVEGMLPKTRSRQVCMTCHFFLYHPGPNCIPLLTCHLHQGLIAHGEHLTHRCSGWSEDLHRQRGWAPEVA